MVKNGNFGRRGTIKEWHTSIQYGLKEEQTNILSYTGLIVTKLWKKTNLSNPSTISIGSHTSEAHCQQYQVTTMFLQHIQCGVVEWNCSTQFVQRRKHNWISDTGVLHWCFFHPVEIYPYNGCKLLAKACFMGTKLRAWDRGYHHVYEALVA